MLHAQWVTQWKTTHVACVTPSGLATGSNLHMTKPVNQHSNKAHQPTAMQKTAKHSMRLTGSVHIVSQTLHLMHRGATLVATTGADNHQHQVSYGTATAQMRNAQRQEEQQGAQAQGQKLTQAQAQARALAQAQALGQAMTPSAVTSLNACWIGSSAGSNHDETTGQQRQSIMLSLIHI